ncbi:hypothetical protein BT69DRAFT_1278824 [Atractiella rhizophila]|nr:hypothetical protein BT69DRAFT_1278824 [Atractiella rhizophila]
MSGQEITNEYESRAWKGFYSQYPCIPVTNKKMPKFQKRLKELKKCASVQVAKGGGTRFGLTISLFSPPSTWRNRLQRLGWRAVQPLTLLTGLTRNSCQVTSV